jgi:hypothetical protein
VRTIESLVRQLFVYNESKLSSSWGVVEFDLMDIIFKIDNERLNVEMASDMVRRPAMMEMIKMVTAAVKNEKLKTGSIAMAINLINENGQKKTTKALHLL